MDHCYYVQCDHSCTKSTDLYFEEQGSRGGFEEGDQKETLTLRNLENSSKASVKRLWESWDVKLDCFSNCLLFVKQKALCKEKINGKLQSSCVNSVWQGNVRETWTNRTLSTQSFFFFFLAVLSLHCCGSLFSGFSEWGLLSGHGAQVSQCSSFSCCGKWA